VLQLGGPFSPIVFLLKLIVVSVAMLVVWWIAHRWKGPRLGMATIIAPAATYAAVVANNVIVAAKKVKKTVAGKRYGCSTTKSNTFPRV